MNEAAIVIGASTGVGREISKIFAKKGIDVILSARNIEELIINSKDIEIRNSVKAMSIPIDLNQTNNEIWSEYLKKCTNFSSNIKYLVITAGLNIDEDNENIELDDIDLIVNSNYLGPAKLIRVFVEYARLNSDRNFNIAVCSSIAAATPRSKNLTYSSAKMALEGFCRGIQHSVADSRIHLQYYRLGYVDTVKSYGMKLMFPGCSPEFIGNKIYKNLQKENIRFLYIPFFWKFIILVLQFVPWRIFKKMKF